MLAQYDAISTNGGASLPAYVSLANVKLIEAMAEHIGHMGKRYTDALKGLAEAFPQRIEEVHGKGLLAGIKFRRVDDALVCHKKCVEEGLWVRVHAYHEGHRTLLTKLALCVEEEVIDSLVARLRGILEG